MSDPGSALNALLTRCVLSLLMMAIGVETTRCFSCASTAYLSLWNQLMHHYFPPKNFTERCWQPDADVGTVPCASACFTLVEQVYEHFATHAVMRGCVDRFLLFGLDEDVRDALVDRSECRATDRQLLHLVSLSPDTDLVLVCSCTGTLCNNANMDHVVSSSRQPVVPLTSLLIIATLLTSYCSMWNI